MPLKKKYKQIKVKVCCVPDCEQEIEDIFYAILDDYCDRFNVKPDGNKWQVNIFFAEQEGESLFRGVHIIEAGSNKINLQIRDPLLSEWEDNFFTVLMMVETMCHEMVHACQTITGRKGIKLTKTKVNKKDDEEKYFFDPFEVEARVLEGFYTSRFCSVLL
jgi:hypothetical protein